MKDNCLLVVGEGTQGERAGGSGAQLSQREFDQEEAAVAHLFGPGEDHHGATGAALRTGPCSGQVVQQRHRPTMRQRGGKPELWWR